MSGTVVGHASYRSCIMPLYYSYSTTIYLCIFYRSLLIQYLKYTILEIVRVNEWEEKIIKLFFIQKIRRFVISHVQKSHRFVILNVWKIRRIVILHVQKIRRFVTLNVKNIRKFVTLHVKKIRGFMTLNVQKIRSFVTLNI